MQEVVPGRKHTPGNRLSNWLLGFVLLRYREGPSLAFDESARFVREIIGKSSSGGSAAGPASSHGLIADDSSLDDDDGWDFGDLHTSGAPDPLSPLNYDFDQLDVDCKQAGMAKPATVADVVAMAKAGLKSQRELPPKVASV